MWFFRGAAVWMHHFPLSFTLPCPGAPEARMSNSKAQLWLMQDVWERSFMNKSSPKHQDHAQSLLSPKQDLQRVRARGAFLWGFDHCYCSMEIQLGWHKMLQEKASGWNQHKQISYFHVNVSSNKSLRQEVIKKQSRKKPSTKTGHLSTTTGHKTVPKWDVFQKFSMRCPLRTAENINCIQTHI